MNSLRCSADLLRSKRRLCSRSASALFSVFLLMQSNLPVSVVRGADFNEARTAFYTGDYDRCIEITQAEVERGIWNDFWSRQLMTSLLETGRYEEACDVYESVESKFSNSIPLRVLAAKAYRFSGDFARGNKLLEEIPDMVQAAPWRYSDRDNMLAVGRYLLGEGADARDVLEAFYDRVLKNDAKYVDAHVAIAQLALDKADYQEAVKSLRRALELRPEDPQIHYLMAVAWAPSDSEQATNYLNSALDINPNHSDSLLLQARHLIDSEAYDGAEQILNEVLEVNSHHPRAWALKAAIAHLKGKYQEEGQHRAEGLSTWQVNPEVDHLIGATLSKHYRFAEGVKYQRRALKLDPEFLKAKFQLAQDLLRVGQDDEGWSIVDQVAASDKYNVVAFNLKTLQDRISKFRTIEVPGFIIRMDARESQIYGPRVVQLLQEASKVLSEKYDFELTRPVTVEIFPQQSDFAIRTFGLPGGAGFLGVCFGSLITANSPASQGETPSNWESVLWHEFCHVITLQKTNNRMPRWLSEGISVYEELERDSSWGQRMTPMYKTMLLGDDFVPLSQLSGAFLRPKSPIHLQFAYFESSLAVRYLVERHDRELLLKLLEDLGMGVTTSDAFERRFGDAELLDQDFEKYVKDMATSFVEGTDFEREGLPQRASIVDLEHWLKEHPKSYFAQRQIVARLLAQEEWSEAQVEAEKLLELFPEDSDPGGALETLAAIARHLDDRPEELKYLKQIADLSSDNVPVLLRIIAICREAEDWQQLDKYADKLLGVQPLIATGHEARVEAAEQLQTPGGAIPSLRALQEMEPLDPAGLHFQLAQWLKASNMMEEARREVLLALEYTPRYREAQRLLVEVHHHLNAPPPAESIEMARPQEGRPPSPSRG